jgi:hypothetical protein
VRRTGRSAGGSSGRLPVGCRSSNNEGRLHHAQVNDEVEGVWESRESKRGWRAREWDAAGAQLIKAVEWSNSVEPPNTLCTLSDTSGINRGPCMSAREP